MTLAHVVMRAPDIGRTFVSRLARARGIGLRRLLRCRVDRWLLGLIARRYKFDPWHASAPYSCRPYKKAVVDLVNGLAPSSVVEVGCGLGDIVSRIDAPNRFGYDTDRGVVRAARLLHGRRLEFVEGDASNVAQSSMDVLIMVNWLHNVSPSELGNLLPPLADRAKYLVFDAMDFDAPASYRYRHDFALLDGVAERVSTTRVPDEPRSFYLFRVIA